MSAPGPGYTDERQQRGVSNPVGMNYVFTEEEKRVFKECDHESFWYRSVPFSLASMTVTHALVARGILSASPRFGSLPKMCFAGFCGYLAGKISYMKTCQERFKLLENSPLGDALRQRSGLPQQYANYPQSEMDDTDTSGQSLSTMFQSDTESQTIAQSKNYEYGYSQDPPIQVEQEDLTVSDQQYIEEKAPARRTTTSFEDLRRMNRENYETKTMTSQKAETLQRPTQQREPEIPKKETKKNIYGDTWED